MTLDTNGHLSDATLAAFRARSLSARNLLRADEHLAQCDACAARLMSEASPARARAAFRHVLRPAAQHLDYEALEAWIDGRASAEDRARVDAHLLACAACSREASALAREAPALRERLAPIAAAQPSPAGGFLARLRDWLGGANALRPVIALLVVAIGVAVLVPRQEEREIRVDPSARVLTQRFDLSAVSALPAETARAFLAGRYAEALPGIRARAESGDASAKVVLAVMLADGLGVPQDRSQAKALLEEAARLGEPSAAANLARLATQ